MRTEDLSPRFEDLDAWSSLEAVHAMFEGQLSAVAAVRPALPDIVAAGEAAAVRPLYAPMMAQRAMAAAAPTPIESGSVSVEATVTITLEVAP